MKKVVHKSVFKCGIANLCSVLMCVLYDAAVWLWAASDTYRIDEPVRPPDYGGIVIGLALFFIFVAVILTAFVFLVFACVQIAAGYSKRFSSLGLRSVMRKCTIVFTLFMYLITFALGKMMYDGWSLFAATVILSLFLIIVDWFEGRMLSIYEGEKRMSDWRFENRIEINYPKR